MASTSIPVTVSYAVSFLTRPLKYSYNNATLIQLRSILEANLTAHYAPTWYPLDPLEGSRRRCLTLSPDRLPHRVIYSACTASGVQWFDWIKQLGGFEFDLLVNPGSVCVRVGGKLETIWPADRPSPVLSRNYDEAAIQTALARQADARAKTMAQQLLESDHEDEELFFMIRDEVSAPTWVTPTKDNFPVIMPRSSSPLSAISSDSSHSRCSSRSGYSTFSSDSSSPTSIRSGNGSEKMSRRERARQARVYIDTSRTEVTPYDGGKTTVLTGGVMLGDVTNKQHHRQESLNSYCSPTNSWRPRF